MKNILRLFLVFSIAGLCQGSALSDATAALAEGDTVSFTRETSFSRADLAWNTNGVYDPARGIIHVMGKPANNNTAWYHAHYDIATDTWTPKVNMGWNGAGHIYGNFSWDPATGDLFQSVGGDKRIKRYDAASRTWTQLSVDIYAGSIPSHLNGMAWHPNLYGTGDGGLVVQGTSRQYYWRKSTNSVQDATTTNLGQNAGDGIYFAAIDKVVIGRTPHVLVSNGGSQPLVEDVGAPPVKTGGLSTAYHLPFGVMIQHPGNSAKIMLIEREGSKRVWESTDGDNWAQMSQPHPFSGAPVFTSIRGMGVVWVISGDISCLWRPYGSRPDTLDQLIVSPDGDTVEQDHALQFTVQALNTQGADMAEPVNWTVTGGGSIDASGLFTASGNTGTFDVTATGTSNSGISHTVQITVIPPIPDTLSAIVVTPDSAVTSLNGTVQYSAQGKNQFDEDMVANVTWSVSSGGAIDASGLFTANGTAGNYTVTATAVSNNAVQGTAALEVVEVTSSLIVDFGPTTGSDIFGTTQLTTLLKDRYTKNVDIGPGGMTINNSHGAYNFQGAQGTQRVFLEGDKIVVTWYNDSSIALTFTPRISFDDPDRRASGTVGTWYDMTEITLPSKGTGVSEYVFTAATAGSHSLVNVNCNIANRDHVICDKIEHQVESAVEAIPAVIGVADISVYPNPFNPVVCISLNSVGVQYIESILNIYNTNGRIIDRIPIKKNRAVWRAEGQPAGIYIARIVMNNKTFTKQLFLIK